MGRPKEKINSAKHIGVKYCKRAGMWCYSQNYNTENIADKRQWFSTEKEALEEMNK